MIDQLTVELDIAEVDLGGSGVSALTAVEWVESYGCTAELATTQSCPGANSYVVTGPADRVRQLMDDGGYLDDDFYEH